MKKSLLKYIHSYYTILLFLFLFGIWIYSLSNLTYNT